MVKDNNLKGIGNSLDFGARVYDSRLGRWLSIDPLQKHYSGLSPYIFSIDNPIVLRDADGNVVVDRMGNPVTVTYSKNSSGQYVANFAFTEGTTEAVKEHFYKNGGEVINTLIQVQTGRDQVDKVINSADKIHTTLIPAKGNKPVYSKEGIKLGETKSGFLNNDPSDPYISVTIYGASIERALDAYLDPSMIHDPTSPAAEWVNNDLSEPQRVGSVTAHEYEHATNPVDVKLLKEGRKVKAKDPLHKVSYEKGTKVSNEFGELNRKRK